jgi:hypothetical protein
MSAFDNRTKDNLLADLERAREELPELSWLGFVKLVIQILTYMSEE